MPEIIVTTAELLPGDVLTACRSVGSNSWHPWLSVYTVMSIPVAAPHEPSMMGFDLIMGGAVTPLRERRATSMSWKVQRQAASVGESKTVAMKGAKVIDEFPHACTRCGRKAYVSAFSVSHQNEKQATDCPARRG